MENLENMEEIEALQTELGQFLVSIIPVPWEKICFYSDALPGTASSWFAFVEQKTDVVCTQDFFWDRYDQYPLEKMETYDKLLDLACELYNAYLEKYGEEKIWRAMYYTLLSDGSVHIDFEYELLPGNLVEQGNAVYRRFFQCEYTNAPKGKYPATE